MEKYFPFMSVGGDRKYNADNWAEYFALFLCDGVFYSSVDRLRVTASDGMKVRIGKGAAFISGRCYILDADLDVTLDLADGALNRIDRIVIRCDYTERNITAKVKKGAYSASPVARELQRDADAYELAIADVYVGKGAVTITTANITDLRLNMQMCGIVTGMVEQADTSEIFDQFFAALLEFKNVTKADIDAWTEVQQQAFLTWTEEKRGDFTSWYERSTTAWTSAFTNWFDDIQGMLSGDVATNLTNRVIQLEERAANLEASKAERVLIDETQQAAGEGNPQGFSLAIINGALCVRRVV